MATRFPNRDTTALQLHERRLHRDIMKVPHQLLHNNARFCFSRQVVFFFGLVTCFSFFLCLALHCVHKHTHTSSVLGAKAFCAGGDVVAVVKSGRGGDDGGAMARDFFREEYVLDHILATMEETPYIAIMDGITMGGGTCWSAAFCLITLPVRLYSVAYSPICTCRQRGRRQSMLRVGTPFKRMNLNLCSLLFHRSLSPSLMCTV